MARRRENDRGIVCEWTKHIEWMVGVRERKLRDKNKGTWRGVGIYWTGCRAYKDRKRERDARTRERMERIPREMVEREITGKGQTVVMKWKAREKEKEREKERGSELWEERKNVEICCRRAFVQWKCVKFAQACFIVAIHWNTSRKERKLVVMTVATKIEK